VSQFYHIEDYETSFRWAATEPLPAPFTIPEKFLLLGFGVDPAG
jgi:hypothetical protein